MQIACRPLADAWALWERLAVRQKSGNPNFFLKSVRRRASAPRPDPVDTYFGVKLRAYGDNLGIRAMGPAVARLDRRGSKTRAKNK